MKRLQNRIAESGLTLPVMSAFGLCVWLASGLLAHGWWPQLVCFILSVYQMVEMNNAFALLRVRSRMVSSSFIGLSCTMSFLFGSLTGGLVQLFVIAALLLLLSTYQNQLALGRIFYAFALIGLASILFVQVLFLVPLLWLLMAMHLQSLSWRGLMASLIGLVAPYWFFSLWFIYQRDFTPLGEHFAGIIGSIGGYGKFWDALWSNGEFSDELSVNVGRWGVVVSYVLAYVFTAVVAVTGMVNFWRNSMDEKIRIRLFYGLFSWIVIACLLLTALMPQHYDPLMRIAVVSASPLIAHFLTLTSSRITNIAFFVILGIAFGLTVGSVVL